MANAPLSGRDDKPHRLICISEKQKYFCQRDWTGQITLIRLGKSDFSRNAPRARAGGLRGPSAQISPKPLTGGSAARCEASHALSYFRFRGIADMAAFAAGSTGSRLTRMDHTSPRIYRHPDDAGANGWSLSGIPQFN
jgi:hypothetical protein